MFKKIEKHKVNFRDAMSHDQTSWNLKPIKNKTPIGKILIRIIVWATIFIALYAIFRPHV